MRRRWSFGLILLLGCTAATSGGSVGSSGPGRDTPTPPDPGGPGVGGGGGPDTPADMGSTPDTGIDACASVEVRATTVVRPVDIIWVVDSSGSMDNEAARVQANMNHFASGILGAGVDPHVVVITDSYFVTVPPPLGTDSAHYRFVEQNVRSHAPLDVLLNTWSQYADFLRPDAVTHFIAVTDDQSDLSAADFRTQMMSRLGHPFTFHAIASPDVGGGWPCDGAANPGLAYYNLADMTGGMKVSICTTDWAGVFMTLASAVSGTAALPCTFDVPAPPMGEMLDYMQVNVRRTAGDGTTSLFPFVGSSMGCTGGGGWYYDNPTAPTKIQLCPGTCMAVDADTGGSVSIALGCQTVLQ